MVCSAPSSHASDVIIEEELGSEGGSALAECPGGSLVDGDLEAATVVLVASHFCVLW